MPQNLVPLATVAVVNTAGLQEQINLSAAGSLAVVGNPGGPVIFANYGSTIVPALSGGIPRSIVGGK